MTTTDSKTDSVNPLFKLGSYLRKGKVGPEGQQIFLKGGRRADIFYRKGINNRVEFWGEDVKHDWDWWYKQLEYYLPYLLED